jgi:ATP/ADP translocase
MWSRLFHVREGELRRLAPFFFLYFVLFGAFSLADGLAMALFVSGVGAAELPTAYALTAVINLGVMAFYVMCAERLGSLRTFHWILGGAAAIFGVGWLGIAQYGEGTFFCGLLFAAREIGFALMLLHYGTFLLDYFSRDELNRVLPLIYSGGRVGGIVGGRVLEDGARLVGLFPLIGLFIGLCLVSAGLLSWATRRLRPHPEMFDAGADPGLKPTADETLEQQARVSFTAFLRYVWHAPLLFWTSIATLLFMVCRWTLNYQYNSFFSGYFETPVELAEFLGRYTQWALLGSLLVQTLIVNRLVAWFGLKVSHLLYGSLVLGGMFLGLAEMTLAVAIILRLLETELRFGLRNPIMQLITNKFSKSLRVRVRAWSFGVVLPLGTLATALLLQKIANPETAGAVPWLGVIAGVAHLAASVALVSSFREGRHEAKSEPTPPASSDERLGLVASVASPGIGRTHESIIRSRGPATLEGAREGPRP